MREENQRPYLLAGLGTYQVHGMVQLGDGILAALFGIANLGDGFLVCSLPQLGRKRAQSHIVAGFIRVAIKSFGQICLMVCDWSVKEIVLRK